MAAGFCICGSSLSKNHPCTPSCTLPPAHPTYRYRWKNEPHIQPLFPVKQKAKSKKDTRHKADAFYTLVDPERIELLTSAMRTQRSPS